MIQRPPVSTRPDQLFPYTTRFLSLHPHRVLLPRVRLDQQAEAVAQLEIAVREAWRGDAVDEAGRRVVFFHERRIEGQRMRALRGDRIDQRRAHRQAVLETLLDRTSTRLHSSH